MTCYNTSSLDRYLDKMSQDDIEDAYCQAAEMATRLKHCKALYKELYAMLYGKEDLNHDDLADVMENMASYLSEEYEDLYPNASLPTVQRYGQEPNYQAIQFVKRKKSAE